LALPRTADRRIDWMPFVLALGTAAAIVAVTVLADRFLARYLVFALLAAAAVFAYRATLDADRKRPVAVGVLLGCATCGVYTIAGLVVANVHAPPTWDFFSFYMDANVGARRLNFYDAENYRRVFQEMPVPIALKSQFVPEIVEIGFKYPPITMFLLFGIGYLPFEQAHAVWLSSVCAAFVLATWALGRHLLVDGTQPVRWLVALSFVALLPASLNTMKFEQTSALLLAVSVLCLAAKSDRRSGVLAALAFTVKPILVLAAGYHFLRARWVAVGIFVVTVAALLAAAAAVFGPDTVLDYFRANPIGKSPPWIFTEKWNQSLLATLVRMSDTVIPASEAILYPPFLVIGGAIAAISAWLAWQLARRGDTLAFGLLVGGALLLYPGVQKPYGMLLLIPIVQIGLRLWRTTPGTACFAAFAGVIYYVEARMPFAANAAVWAAACVWAAFGGRLESYFEAGRVGRRAA
jgi:hypothetical protein